MVVRSDTVRKKRALPPSFLSGTHRQTHHKMPGKPRVPSRIACLALVIYFLGFDFSGIVVRNPLFGLGGNRQAIRVDVLSILDSRLK